MGFQRGHKAARHAAARLVCLNSPLDRAAPLTQLLLCKPEGQWHPSIPTPATRHGPQPRDSWWPSDVNGGWRARRERRREEEHLLPTALLKAALHSGSSACVCCPCGAGCYAGVADRCRLRLSECWGCLRNPVKRFQQFS